MKTYKNNEILQQEQNYNPIKKENNKLTYNQKNINKQIEYNSKNIQQKLTTVTTKAQIHSEFDAENNVHVIHVNSKDQYDQLIASPEFSGIINRYSEKGNNVNIPELVCNF